MLGSEDRGLELGTSRIVTKQHRQEGICKAYVRAIAVQAGLICSEPEGDYGIDLCLRAIQSRGPWLADAGGQLDLQLRRTTRAHVSDSVVLLDLEKKAYDDLRETGGKRSMHLGGSGHVA